MCVLLRKALDLKVREASNLLFDTLVPPARLLLILRCRNRSVNPLTLHCQTLQESGEIAMVVIKADDQRNAITLWMCCLFTFEPGLGVACVKIFAILL